MISFAELKSTLFRLAVPVLSLLVMAPMGKAAERPSHFGVAPAYPVKVPQSYPLHSKRQLQSESVASIILTVDSNGAVTEISWPKAGDSVLAGIFDPVIDSLEFAPGLIDGRPAEQTVPVQFYFNTLQHKFSFDFPVNTAVSIEDPDLYFQAIALNGVQLPELEYFPSYFYQVQPKDTPGVCPYTLAKVSLDSLGHLTAIEPIHSGPSSFDRQVLTAAHWAAFRPAQVNGMALGCDAFLVVTFLPGAAYPTKPLAGPQDSLPPPERLRVRLYADTVGLMIKPIAVDPGYDGVYVPGGGSIQVFDAASARIAVDTLGSATFLRATGCASRTYDILSQLLSNLRFVPAADFTGRPQNWEGLLQIKYVDSTKIRIGYTWFPGARFPGSR